MQSHRSTLHTHTFVILFHAYTDTAFRWPILTLPWLPWYGEVACGGGSHRHWAGAVAVTQMLFPVGGPTAGDPGFQLVGVFKAHTLGSCRQNPPQGSSAFPAVTAGAPTCLSPVCPLWCLILLQNCRFLIPHQRCGVLAGLCKFFLRHVEKAGNAENTVLQVVTRYMFDCRVYFKYLILKSGRNEWLGLLIQELLKTCLYPRKWLFDMFVIFSSCI